MTGFVLRTGLPQVSFFPAGSCCPGMFGCRRDYGHGPSDIAVSSRVPIWIVMQSIAACMWMAATLYNPAIRRWLSTPLFLFAGKISFALYLVHLLVLCSFSAWLYILLLPAGPTLCQGFCLYGASLVVSIAVAVPLMLFDQWWIGLLNNVFRMPGVSTADRRIGRRGQT